MQTTLLSKHPPFYFYEMTNRYGSYGSTDLLQKKNSWDEPLELKETWYIHSYERAMAYFMHNQKDMKRLYKKHGIAWMNEIYIIGRPPTEKDPTPGSFYRIIYDIDEDCVLFIFNPVEELLISLTEKVQALELKVAELLQ